MKQLIELFYLLLLSLMSCQANTQKNTTLNTREVPSLKKTTYKGVPNDSLLAHIERAIVKEPKYQELLQKAKDIHSSTLAFQDYIDKVRERMVEESGGAYTLEEARSMGNIELEGRLKGKKDKDSPQRIFVTGDYGAAGKKEPEGKVLAGKIKNLKEHYDRLIKELPGEQDVLEELKFGIKLIGEEGYDPRDHNELSWSEFMFGHMPVAAIYPMLRKFQNDAKDSETIFLTFLIQQIDGISFSAEERSYYALMNQLDTRVMSSPGVDNPTSFGEKNPKYIRIATQIKKVKEASLAFNTYVNLLTEQMIEESGGRYTKEEAKEAGNSQLQGKLKGGNNKDVPQRIFITGNGNKKPQGKVLVKKIKQLKADYIRLVGELWNDGGIGGTVFALQDKKEEILALLSSRISLINNGYEPTTNEEKTWEEKAFEEMPVKSIVFMLFHIEQEVRQSEMVVMNFLISPIKNYN